MQQGLLTEPCPLKRTQLGTLRGVGNPLRSRIIGHPGHQGTQIAILWLVLIKLTIQLSM